MLDLHAVLLLLILLDQILKLPIVVNKAKDELTLVAANEAMAEGEMLGTIALPRNLDILSSRLPKPNYESVQDKRDLIKVNEMPMGLNKRQQIELIERGIEKIAPPLIRSVEKRVELIHPRPVIQKIEPEIIKPYRYRNEVQKVINSQQVQSEKDILDIRPSYLAERNKRKNLKDNISLLYSNERKITSSQEPKRYQDLPPIQYKPSTRQQDRHPLPRVCQQKIPFLKNPQVEKPIIGQKKIASVDSMRIQEQNKRLAEYYKANPMKIKLNYLHYERQHAKPYHNIGNPKVNNELIYNKKYKGHLDNLIYKNKPQYNSKQHVNNKEFEYKKAKHYYNGKEVESGNGVIMQKHQLPPVKKVILQRPHYNVLPEWWG